MKKMIFLLSLLVLTQTGCWVTAQEGTVQVRTINDKIDRIIRPEDVTAANTINQTQIAEARISYGGRGQLSAVQRPNWGQRIGDAISPW